MPTGVHFNDWSALAERDKAAALKRCRTRLHRLGRKLHAVVAEFAPAPPVAGPLAGMPYVAKDLFATGVLAPSWGSAEPTEAIGARAPALQRLDRAGACLIAMAEMTELAYEPSGTNPVRGRALNPWNTDFVSGGSSSGSAVLVAAGCCYLALGSDTGGSVRIPAHCCGITALKPSWGGIPVEGAMALAPSLDTIGIMARSAADLAQVWPVIAGKGVTPQATRFKLAMLSDAFGASDPAVARACREALDALAGSDITIVPRGGFPEEADRQTLLVMQAEAARTHRDRLEDVRIDATLRKRLGKGLTISDAELSGSLAARAALRAEFLAHVLGEADAALLPTMPIGTPRIADVDPASAGFRPRMLYAMSRFTRFANYLGLPVLAVPVGADDHGMPVGLQIVGRPQSDALLLEIGMQLQRRTDWHRRIPSAIVADIDDEGMNA